MDKRDYISKFYFEPDLRSLIIGDFLPNILLNEELYIYDLITDHLFLGIYDINCHECIEAIEDLYILLNKYPLLNAALLINAEESQINIIANEFTNKANVFNFDTERMISELNTNSFPKGYTINVLGQVVSVRTAMGIESLEKLISPFKNYEFVKGQIS